MRAESDVCGDGRDAVAMARPIPVASVALKRSTWASIFERFRVTKREAAATKAAILNRGDGFDRLAGSDLYSISDRGVAQRDGDRRTEGAIR